MVYRLRLVGIVAVAFFTSAGFVQGQNAGVASGPASAVQRHFGYQNSAAYQDGGSSGRYVYAPTPKAQDSGQQQSNSTQAQSQSGNQDQGMNGSQNQAQSQNQNQDQVENGQAKKKEEAPPKKPSYLTYSVQKKSLDEQAKSGKTLSVDFKSVPAGASITVDGYFVGRTPTTKQIPVGKHLVSITKWGYQTWAQELDVSTGKNLSVTPTLHKDW
jgi:PEGA domain